MKILVGVDSGGVYQPALSMVARLGFASAEIHLVNCVSSVMVDGSFPEPTAGGVLSEINEQIKADGLAQLEKAEALVKGASKVVKHQAFGDAAVQLREYAEREQMDLVAVASRTKDYLGSLFFGSVAKGLVTSCSASVLVVKDETVGIGKVKAVLGTDHSNYFEKCKSQLLSWKPTGLESIHIVSAYGSTKRVSLQHAEAIAQFAKSAQSEVSMNLSQQNEKLSREFSILGAKLSSEAVMGRPGPVLDEAYLANHADLLILGAQGHGFFERLTLGSVSFHQVVSTSHNVLVLRS